MQVIQFRKLMMGLISLVLFVLFLFAGFAHWAFFIPAAFFAGSWYIIDRKFLRCPHCHGFINLATLFDAVKNERHCIHCGEVIRVEK